MNFFIIFVIIFTFFNIKIASSRNLNVKRSPDFWDSIKGIFDTETTPMVATSTSNPCLGYSQDGYCLGDIDEELVEYKCMFCSKKCKDGTLLDKDNLCRRIVNQLRSKQ